MTELDLEALARRESCEFPGFNERLVSILPGLREHTCAAGHPGAFVSRLQGGTYFGHIVEHVALELSGMVDIGVRYGKTRVIQEPALYAIVVRYRNEAGMRRLVEVAVDLVQSVLEARAYPLESELDNVRRIIARSELGPSTACIVTAAQRRNIPVRRLSDNSLVQLGFGRHRRLIQAAFTDGTSGIGAEIASDKNLTKQLLRDAFAPVPEGDVVRSLDEARAAWERAGRRAVVKPLDGNQGRAVTTGVDTEQALAEAFERARDVSSAVIVEEQFEGDDYRVLVVNGTVIAASLRRPPEVIGDGRSTVAELIDVLNTDPQRGEGHEKPLTRVDASDPVLLATVARQGLDMQSRPPEGRVVRLRESANLSTGGTAADVTHVVDPSVRQTCERAARLIGLDICGVDLVTRDISRPLSDTGGGIIEVNAGPGLRMHQFPSAGTPQDVGGAIVDMLFPGGSTGRIPIVAITGTNGKTTVSRMIAHALRATGASVGMTTTDGIYVNGREVAHGDMTGPRSAHVVLSDPVIDVAVLETARGGIVRGGLGYDWSDVAVMTNVQLDHVGQDGIANLDDLLHIKSLVVERVRDGGTVILNADDRMVLSLADNPRFARRHCRIVLFSMFPNAFVVRRHIAAGGTAYVPRDGWIVELSANGPKRLVQISAIPATFAGAAKFNVANALAAVAACRAMGASQGLLKHALADFEAIEQNTGRLNVFDLPKGRVLVDYGHNPAAFEAVAEVARAWRRNRVIGVIGVPGDRADHVGQQAASVAARAFDVVYIKEDEDTRGRRRGEIAELLCAAVSAEAADRPCHVMLDEGEAVRAAVAGMQQGDLVVIFYDRLPVVLEVLRECGAAPFRRRPDVPMVAQDRYGT